MVEIIKKVWSKEEILTRIGALINQKNALTEMNQDTTEVEVLLQNWKDRYAELDN